MHVVHLAARRPLTLGAVLLFALVASGCSGAPTTVPSGAAGVPSFAEAEHHLDAAVAVVRSGDLTHLCDLGSATCQHTLDISDPAAVPTSGPDVLGSRVIGTTATSAGGLVLELCGRDGLGHSYYSEMLVFRDGQRLLSTGTVYWVGITIPGTSTTGQVPPRTCTPTSS